MPNLINYGKLRLKMFDGAMDELPLNAWNDLAANGLLRSQWAEVAFSFSNEQDREQWLADEAVLLQEKGFNTEAIAEYQYYLPLLAENPAIISYIRMLEDYGYQYPVPNLRNIFDVLNWIGQTQHHGELRDHLCFLLRAKLIAELKDVVSANELAMMLDEQMPSSHLVSYL